MRVVGNLRAAIMKGWEYVLNTGRVVEQKHWQGVEAPRPMFEALDYDFKCVMPHTRLEAQKLIEPNITWSEEHFSERVGGEPLNPPPSHELWPFANKSNEAFQKNKRFDHTYPERFWPRYAADKAGHKPYTGPLKGIRFEYGDLQSVVTKLQKDPGTRQAFLPIWFPEDTGKPHDIRVPCSIGYHFLIREGRLDITYWMRSLDMLRHFQDDVYLCWKLARWMWDLVDTNNLGQITQLGYMKFHAISCHIFDGEQKLLENKISTWKNIQ